MSVRFFQHPDEAANALFDYLMEDPDKLPMKLWRELMMFLRPGRSISFAVSEAAEFIFARKSDLPNGTVKIGAELATTASLHKVNNFADDQGKRGQGIVTALLRHSGQKPPVGQEWAGKEEDPAPKPEYLPLEKETEKET